MVVSTALNEIHYFKPNYEDDSLSEEEQKPEDIPKIRIEELDAYLQKLSLQ